MSSPVTVLVLIIKQFLMSSLQPYMARKKKIFSQRDTFSWLLDLPLILQYIQTYCPSHWADVRMPNLCHKFYLQIAHIVCTVEQKLMSLHCYKSGILCTSLVPRPSYGKIEKGSGQKGRISLSSRMKSSRANQIEERCHMTNGMLNRYVTYQRMRTFHWTIYEVCKSEYLTHMRKFEYLIKILLGWGSATLLTRPFLNFSVGTRLAHNIQCTRL